MAHKDAHTKPVFEGDAGMDRVYVLALEVFQGEEKSVRVAAAKTGEGFIFWRESSQRPIPAAREPSGLWSFLPLGDTSQQNVLSSPSNFLQRRWQFADCAHSCMQQQRRGTMMQQLL